MKKLDRWLEREARRQARRPELLEALLLGRGVDYARYRLGGVLLRLLVLRTLGARSHVVLPEWNDMTYVVCMTVPAGASVVVARGRGSWKAMKTPAGKLRPGANRALDC